MKYSDQEYIEYNPTNVFNSKLLPPPSLFQPTVFLSFLAISFYCHAYDVGLPVQRYLRVPSLFLYRCQPLLLSPIQSVMSWSYSWTFGSFTSTFKPPWCSVKLVKINIHFGVPNHDLVKLFLPGIFILKINEVHKAIPLPILSLFFFFFAI